LVTSDLQYRDGTLCFNINDDGDDKRLKTSASARIVPVHSRLLQLGLTQFVGERGSGKLFPDYPYSEKHGLSRNLSRWFNDTLLTRLNIKADQLVLHSLRHTMNTKLHHANVAGSIVKAITGHTDDSMSTGRYFSSGFKVQQLQEAIEKFSFRQP
jgi:integrase